MGIAVDTLAKRIDHAILKPSCTQAEVEACCEMAKHWGIAALFVRPCDLFLAVERLRGSGVHPGTVVGFPHGDVTTATKVFEAEEALKLGAEEIDMVVNVGWVLSGLWEQVYQDIDSVLQVVRGGGKILKVILETSYLSDAQKMELCELCGRLGVDFVKTSTGFAPSGAQLEEVRRFREILPEEVEIKASAGIRTLEQAMAFLDAGATRLGTSSTEAILEAFQEEKTRRAGSRM